MRKRSAEALQSAVVQAVQVRCIHCAHSTLVVGACTCRSDKVRYGTVVYAASAFLHALRSSNAACIMQALSKELPQLRKVALRLTIDMLAIASAVRPAVMLDYAPRCKPGSLARACQSISAALPAADGTEATSLWVLRWQGLLWVVNDAQLRQRLGRIVEAAEADGGEELWLICFEEARGRGAIVTPTSSRPVRVASLNLDLQSLLICQAWWHVAIT
jgi:hypothetical protein